MGTVTFEEACSILGLDEIEINLKMVGLPKNVQNYWENSLIEEAIKKKTINKITMGKINFTKEHFSKMCDLLLGMLLENKSIDTKMGMPLNVVELLHTTTIGTLNSIRVSLGKKIENLENQDEWVSSEETQSKLDDLKASKELVNLVIGYKRFNIEREETKHKKAELTAKIKELEESQKTPEDKLNELKAQLESLDDPQF